MIKDFIKYQSLGNDFILLDYVEKPPASIQKLHPSFIRKVCDRHFGIGADGILVVTGLPEMFIFNSDGSAAQMCINGSSCAAHFLSSYLGSSFNLKVGSRIIKCVIKEDEVTTTHEPASYKDKMSIKISAGEFLGHVIEIGNPHFVIFSSSDRAWLFTYGKELESHLQFPLRTNVEFVWPLDDKTYQLLVYERGCGLTLACGSGVAAALWALFHQGIVKQKEPITFNMLGGSFTAFIDLNKNIVMKAKAERVFNGICHAFC